MLRGKAVFSYFYCALNFNNYSKYLISIINYYHNRFTHIPIFFKLLSVIIFYCLGWSSIVFFFFRHEAKVSKKKIIMPRQSLKVGTLKSEQTELGAFMSS